MQLVLNSSLSPLVSSLARKLPLASQITTLNFNFKRSYLEPNRKRSNKEQTCLVSDPSFFRHVALGLTAFLKFTV